MSAQPPGRHPLVLATDRPPLRDSGNACPTMRRGHAALMNAVATLGGAWVAATSRPPTTVGSWLRPLHIPADDLRDHRLGHCAGTLAQAYLGYGGIATPRDRRCQAAYEMVNIRYAQAVAGLAAPEAAVWMHDHHLQLAPGVLRQMRDDLRIGFSMHSPFPPAEAFLTLADRDVIMRGLMSTDLMGFHDQRSADNFATLAAILTPNMPLPRLVVHPMPADAQAIAGIATSPAATADSGRVRAALRPAATIIMAVCENDPTDGTPQLIEAFSGLLAAGDLDPSHVALVIIGPAGGCATAEGASQRADIERLTARVNGRYARPGQLVAHYQRRDLSTAELAAFYLAADVLVAAPLRDRPTPSAAEYLAARADGRGRLVISEFSDAAGILADAIVFNPHQPDALATALMGAVRQSGDASITNLAMRDTVLNSSVAGWAQQFLHMLGVHADSPLKEMDRSPREARTTRTIRRTVNLRRRQEGQDHHAQPSDTSGDHLGAQGSPP